MPNWCVTDITIHHENEKELEIFYEKLDEWLNHAYMENDFGSWLGNIVGNSGIGTIDTGKETDLRCRGSVIYISEPSDGELTISTETAWVPMIKMWVKLLDKYLPDAELIYTAEEPGCEIYYTNDPSIAGIYMFDIWDDTNIDIELSDQYFEKEMIGILQELLGSKETIFERLMNEFYNSQLSEQMCIHQYEYIDAERLD